MEWLLDGVLVKKWNESLDVRPVSGNIQDTATTTTRWKGKVFIWELGVGGCPSRPISTAWLKFIILGTISTTPHTYPNHFVGGCLLANVNGPLNGHIHSALWTEDDDVEGGLLKVLDWIDGKQITALWVVNGEWCSIWVLTDSHPDNLTGWCPFVSDPSNFHSLYQLVIIWIRNVKVLNQLTKGYLLFDTNE